MLWINCSAWRATEPIKFATLRVPLFFPFCVRPPTRATRSLFFPLFFCCRQFQEKKEGKKEKQDAKTKKKRPAQISLGGASFCVCVRVCLFLSFSSEAGSQKSICRHHKVIGDRLFPLFFPWGYFSCIFSLYLRLCRREAAVLRAQTKQPISAPSWRPKKAKSQHPISFCPLEKKEKRKKIGARGKQRVWKSRFGCAAPSGA